MQNGVNFLTKGRKRKLLVELSKERANVNGISTMNGSFEAAS
jgi:hypothetical protein